MSIIDPRRLSGSDIVRIAGKRSAICGAAGCSQANALAFRERTEIVTGRFPVRRSFSALGPMAAGSSPGRRRTTLGDGRARSRSADDGGNQQRGVGNATSFRIYDNGPFSQWKSTIIP
jgi:hypothetical protein